MSSPRINGTASPLTTRAFGVVGCRFCFGSETPAKAGHPYLLAAGHHGVEVVDDAREEAVHNAPPHQQHRPNRPNPVQGIMCIVVR